jgi:hypothetical protein
MASLADRISAGTHGIRDIALAVEYRGGGERWEGKGRNKSRNGADNHDNNNLNANNDNSNNDDDDNDDDSNNDNNNIDNKNDKITTIITVLLSKVPFPHLSERWSRTAKCQQKKLKSYIYTQKKKIFVLEKFEEIPLKILLAEEKRKKEKKKSLKTRIKWKKTKEK